MTFLNIFFFPYLIDHLYNKITGYRVMLNIIPEETERIRQMMEDFGLNPDDNREDHSTPVGMGTAINHVGMKEGGIPGHGGG